MNSTVMKFLEDLQKRKAEQGIPDPTEQDDDGPEAKTLRELAMASGQHPQTEEMVSRIHQEARKEKVAAAVKDDGIAQAIETSQTNRNFLSEMDSFL